MIFDLIERTEPFFGIFLKQFDNYVLGFRSQLVFFVANTRPNYLSIDDIIENLFGSVTSERSNSYQELVQNTPKAPKVNSFMLGVIHLIFDQLWSNIVWTAKQPFALSVVYIRELQNHIKRDKVLKLSNLKVFNSASFFVIASLLSHWLLTRVLI
jgi:hypothetical protein